MDINNIFLDMDRKLLESFFQSRQAHFLPPYSPAMFVMAPQHRDPYTGICKCDFRIEIAVVFLASQWFTTIDVSFLQFSARELPTGAVANACDLKRS